MSPSPKVCHLTSVHARYDIRIYYKQCRSLVAAGYTTILIVGDGCPEETVSGVRIVGVSARGSSRLFRMTIGLWRMLKGALQQDADLYHFHDPELLPVGIFLSLLRKKVIYDVHEDVPKDVFTKYWIPLPLRQIVSWSIEKFENFCSRYLTAICVVSESIANRFYCRNDNTVVIYNYPVLSFPLSDVRWDEKKNHICYVGGIDEHRGILQLIDAMGKVNGKLDLAGSFASDDLYQNVRSKDGWDKVVEHGFVSREKVADIYSACKVGVITFLPVPNHVEAIPNKLFEYMAAGLPVVASSFSPWKRIIEGHQCGVCVDPENVDAIANSINRLLGDNKTAQGMGENGRQAVESMYNWGIEGKKLIRLYHKLLYY